MRPTLGARRYSHDLGQRGFVISASGVQKILNRHGLGRRRQRVGALAQLTAATSGLVTDDARQGPFGFCHFAARPGDLVALDSFYIGNLKGVGPVWQLTAVDTATRWAICHVFLGPSNTDIAARFLGLVINKLRRLGVRVTGVLTDNGPEFSAPFDKHLEKVEITHHRTPPRSPNHNAVCERFQGTALQECWRPASSPATFRPAHPTPRRDQYLARRLQHPQAEPQRLHGRTHTTPGARPTPQEPSIMTTTNRVHLSPRPVARKA